MLAPLAQLKQTNRKFWFKRKTTRYSGGFVHSYTQAGEGLGIDFTQLSDDYTLRFLHRSREVVAASLNAATLLLKPMSSFSMSPNKSTSRPNRCNNKTTFAFIKILLESEFYHTSALTVCNLGKRRVGGIRSAPRPSRNQYNISCSLVKGVLPSFFAKTV